MYILVLQVMFRSLEWVIAQNNEASFVARKLQPKLPSFSDEFRCDVWHGAMSLSNNTMK